jgi:galactokinase
MVSAFAPGRLELIGNHTDYNEGYVMAFAINMGITVEGEARQDRMVTITSQEYGSDTFSIDELQKNKEQPWVDYMKGVLHFLKQTGAPLGGFNANVTSTLSSGAGMSSSAAIEVSTALFAQKLFNFGFGDISDPTVRMQIAALCQAAENEFVGVKCGILDQATSLMGKKDHAVFLDCRDNSVQTVPLHPDVCFVVCHTGVKHALLSSKYNMRRSECEEAVKVLNMNKIPVKALRDISSEDIKKHAGLFMTRVFQRAMHVTTENERVLKAHQALSQGDIEILGRLMFESHESSRDAFENSTTYLDELVNIAKTLPGCLGARLTGGGFGGATINMVRRESAEAFMSDLTRIYKEKTSKDPQSWIVEASDGAN